MLRGPTFNRKSLVNSSHAESCGRDGMHRPFLNFTDQRSITKEEELIPTIKHVIVFTEEDQFSTSRTKV